MVIIVIPFLVVSCNKLHVQMQMVLQTQSMLEPLKNLLLQLKGLSSTEDYANAHQPKPMIAPATPPPPFPSIAVC